MARDPVHVHEEISRRVARLLRRVYDAAAARVGPGVAWLAVVGHRGLSACARHPLTVAAACLALVLLLPIVGLVHHIYFGGGCPPHLGGPICHSHVSTSCFLYRLCMVDYVTRNRSDLG